MSRFSKQNTAWLIIGAGFLLYAAVFIWQTSVIVGGERVFALFDDGMISMRYAKNLAHGYGLVWNPGEAPVEGYTNPLWVLYMAVWHLLPIPSTGISVIIQASGALCLLATLVVVRRIAALLTPAAPLVAVGAVVLTAFYYPLINWSLQGMEVGVLTLLTGGAIGLALRGLARQRVEGRVYGLLGLGTLVRPDAVVLFVAVVIFLLAADRRNRRAHLVYGVGAALLFIGGQTLFRLAYYGNPLPNTYYLKVEGYPALLRIGRGAAFLLRFLWDANFFLLLVPLAGLIARRDKGALLLGWVTLVTMGYSVYVGGDAWEWFGGSNRYLSLVMPLVFILLSDGLWGILQHLNRDLRQPTSPAVQRRAMNSVFLLLLVSGSSFYTYLQVRSPLPLSRMGLILVALVLLLTGILLGQRLLTRHSTLPATDQRRFGRYVGGAMLALIGVSLLNLNALHLSDQAGDGANRWVFQIPTEPGGDNQLAIVRAHILSRVTTDPARIAVVQAGTLPYFLDRPMVDLLGKSDPIVAHEPMKQVLDQPPLLQFWPGHMKWDYAYSIGQLAPDVIVQLWPSTATLDRLNLQDVPPDAQPYIDAAYTRVILDGIPFYLRRASPNIRWDVVAVEP